MIELWHLQNVDWLRELPAEVTESLRRSADARPFAENELVFEPDSKPEFVYLLETGLVRIYRESGQAEVFTFGYVRPGEVFGECAMFSDQPRESFAVAVRDSTVLRLARAAFASAIQSKPSIVFAVAKQIEGRFKNIESRVEDLVFRNVRSRLAHMILKLGEQFGCVRDDRTVVQLRLTHAELAALIGASRPSVSIALGELEDEGIVTRIDRHIGIAETEELKRVARGLDRPRRWGKLCP